MARLVRYEDEEYAAPARRIVKLDGETGEMEVLGGRSTSGPPSSVDVEDGAAVGAADHHGEPAWPLPPPENVGEDPLVAEEARLGCIVDPSALLLAVAPLLLVLLLGWFLWARGGRRRQREQPQPQERQPQPQQGQSTARAAPLIRSLGLWSPAGLAALSELANAWRAVLDGALLADNATAARRALGRLEELVAGAPAWTREALGPMAEERDAVSEVEGHYGRLLQELGEATAAGRDALGLLEDEEARAASPLSVSSASTSSSSRLRVRAGSMEEPELHLIAAVARAREALKPHNVYSSTGSSGASSDKGDNEAAVRLQAAFEEAEDVLVAIQHRRDQRVERKIETVKAACQRGVDASQSQPAGAPTSHQPPAPSQQQSAPSLLLENGEGSTNGGGSAEAQGSEPAIVFEGTAPRTPARSQGEQALVPAASGALTTTTAVASTAVVVAGGGGQQDQTALLTQISQSIHMSTMISTMAGRVNELERRLEAQRNTRGTHMLHEASAARAERPVREKRLRDVVERLVAARKARDKERKGAEAARRQGDQTLLTYLLPVSLLAFGVGVVLASSYERGAPSAFLVDALWRVPLHDLVYGACARQAAKAKALVVVHEARPIAGATAAGKAGNGGGASWMLQWLAASLLPAGGVAELSACYVRHTVYLVLGLAAAALLHHLMGGLGLSQHRAKVHVAMLAYAFQRHILRVTWRGLRSLRHLLALHALLWLASSFLDGGHAFARRRLWLRGVVPAVLVAVALYEAAVHVDPKNPLQALALMAARSVEACLSGLGADGEL